LTAVLWNCGYYSFSPSVSGDVKSIAVPQFENQTQEFGLTEALTQGIIDGFINDNSLKVTSADKADAVLTGTITGYERKPFTFDQQENAKEYVIRIYVKADLEKSKDKSKLWEAERLEGWGTFRIIGDPNNPEIQPETEDLGRQRAIVKLAEDIVNRTVKSW
jgi:hypothetical protein